MRPRGSSLMHLDNNSLTFKLRRKVTLMTLNVEGCWPWIVRHSCPTGLQKLVPPLNNAVSSSSVIPATGKRPVIQMQQSLIYLLQQRHAEQQLYSTCQKLEQEPTQASPAAENGKRTAIRTGSNRTSVLSPAGKHGSTAPYVWCQEPLSTNAASFKRHSLLEHCYRVVSTL